MKRTRHSKEFKIQVIKEAMETGKTSVVARRYELNANMVTRWVREYKDGKYGDVDVTTVPDLDSKQLSNENDHLKKILGEKDLEIAILRDLVKKQNPPLAEKIEVADKWIQKGYAIKLVLKLVNVPRSTYYYQKNYRVEEKQVSEGRPAPGYSINEDGKKVSDEQLKEFLLELISGECNGYGYRKLTIMLRRQYSLKINKKKVYRLCKELDILKPQRRKKVSHPRKLARNRVITESNQLWEADIKYGYVHGEDRFLFVFSIIDVYDRSIIDYHIGLRCTADDAVQTLNRALLKRQLFETQEKPVIRTDNGPQFISNTFEDHCENLDVEHERIPPKTPNMNAHIESFHRVMEDDCMSRFEFETYGEAYEAITTFMDFYNNRRIHSSIHDLSPKEFYELQQSKKADIKEIRV
ncbi:IS3 family transposase [Virgibacillus sp. 179-BFC.A HS]|uniref:IS3 family transposase n=1 Tax=Tigheibacillus jepli TaxID=3035914 RepID=A0ABU5CFK7_9BACI|nr:IS3 family transposase [Virgibacillus sp. 179-BFC.A HS]MDY0404652.1 IS3 family transposase [Virgibacillus sp. 179-BFC.A HS]